MRLLLGAERDLLRYIMSMVPNIEDARDILQETAVDLWKKIDQYDPEKPFKAWAFRFASIQVKRYRRQHARWSRFMSDQVAEEIERRRESMEEELDVRREFLETCMSRLPKLQHSLLKGYYYDDSSVEEQAEKSGKSVEAVYKSLQRTRHALMGCIEKRLDAEA